MSGDRLSAAKISAQVRAQERSAVDVASESLARAKKYDAIQPQTWIARFADGRSAWRGRGPWTSGWRPARTCRWPGVPFAMKDNFDLAGVADHRRLPGLRLHAGQGRCGRLPPARRPARCRSARPTSISSPPASPARAVPTAPCGCVFNRAFISGGSSSGSAVATAAGLVAFALGSDTAGSGRVPAAFNGLFGFKPTKGRWSTRGVVPACRSLDCVSVLTPNLADAALIDPVLTGFDEADAYSRAAPEAAASDRDTAALGVPRPSQLDWCGDGQSAALFEAASDAARAGGAELVEVDIAPLLECARLLYQGPWVAERAAAVADLLRSAPNAIHPVVRAILQAGAQVSAVEAFEGFYALKAYRAGGRRRCGATSTPCCCPPRRRSTASPRCWPSRSPSTPTSASTPIS